MHSSFAVQYNAMVQDQMHFTTVYWIKKSTFSYMLCFYSSHPIIIIIYFLLFTLNVLTHLLPRRHEFIFSNAPKHKYQGQKDSRFKITQIISVFKCPQKNLNTSMDRINEVVIMVGIRYAGEQFKLCLAIANDDEVHEP